MEEKIKLKANATRAYKTSDETTELSWIFRDPTSSYFIKENGESWHPIGHNDAMSWPNLVEMFTDPDMTVASDYLRMLRDKGITCLRLMMENCDIPEYMFEDPVGVFNQKIISFWDNMIFLAEKFRIRLLLTPFDTFWMWLNWDKHPYNQKNGGPCSERTHFISDPEVVKAVENRINFMVRRWGKSGAIFAWDLWNEVHPAYAKDEFKHFGKYLTEISQFVRNLEFELYGKTHLQTASIFGPLITDGSKARELKDFEQFSFLSQTIYNSDYFDFATVHTYDQDTLDNPKNTIDPAISMGKLTAKAIKQIHDGRPYLDTEHGPIHAFKDLDIILPQDFDEEYFLFTEYAHLAAGGAGGGMRWPNRHPHVLTPGMYDAEESLAKFCSIIDWKNFKRKNINSDIESSLISLECFGCGTSEKAILWFIRKSTLGKNGQIRYAEHVTTTISLPNMTLGQYIVTSWNTLKGEVVDEIKVKVGRDKKLVFETPLFVKDLAIYIKKIKKKTSIDTIQE